MSAQILPSAFARPEYKPSTGFWPEMHAAVSLIAFGAFALACVAGVMYLVQERLLKKHHLNSVFHALPPIANLSVAVQRLMLAGVVLLAGGIGAGFFVDRSTMREPVAVILWAIGVWLLYGVVLVLRLTHRFSPRRIAWMAVAAFTIALITLTAMSYVHL
jgi:HemX protein